MNNINMFMFNAFILIEFLDLKCIHSHSKMISVKYL